MPRLLPLAAICLLVLCSHALFANELSEHTADTEPTPIAYFLYSGNCSRSVTLVNRFSSLDEAFRAAQKMRRKADYRFLGIATGPQDDAWKLYPSLRQLVKLDACSVYGLGCRRTGPYLLKRTETIEQAEQFVAEEKKKRDIPVEIVYHLGNR